MITLTILTVLALIAVVVTVLSILVGGIGFVVAFGDLIVAVLVIYWICKWILTRHKKKKD